MRNTLWVFAAALALYSGWTTVTWADEEQKQRTTITRETREVTSDQSNQGRTVGQLNRSEMIFRSSNARNNCQAR